VWDTSTPGDKRGVTSGALWDTLRTTCLHMQRTDLAALCEMRDVDSMSPFSPFRSNDALEYAVMVVS
jgi:hypothetical protein